MTIMINLLATIAWLATFILIGLRLRQRLQGQTAQYQHLLQVSWVTALLFHGISVFYNLWQSPGLYFSFTMASSLIMWLCNLLLFITNLKRPLETLVLFILPFTLSTMLIAGLEERPTTLLNLNDGLGLHIFLSLLAYSMLAIAALLALFLAWQNRHLHNHKPSGLIRTLPPLLDMEALLFQFIMLGVALLALGLLTGGVYVDDLFAQHLAHKTLLSILALFVFSTLLYGHWRYGWRGRKAIHWTLSGFILLMLAFFGSKFVLEFLIS